MFTPRYPDFRGENRLWRNNFSPVTQLARCLLKYIAQVHQKNGMGDGSIKQDLETALQQVARTQFACLPTPLMRLHNLERQLGYDGLYIKRDDLTGLGPGGNKLRSLEFIVGEAAAKGRDTLIASGPLQSNLCTLAAAACASAGLRCVLVHNGAEPEHPTGNVLLNQLLGAQSHYIGNVSAQERTDYVHQLAQSLSAHCNPYVIENGATTGTGALGYTNAALELARQFEQQGLRDVTLFAPGGNGGVATGLIYGNALLGFPFRVVIISVEDDRDTLRDHILHTISELQEVLGLPFQHQLEDACILDDSYRGAGWGANTPESSRIIPDFARTEGILLENVYNSKVMVGMQDYIQKRKISGPVCYLHTGGFGSLFAQY